MNISDRIKRELKQNHVSKRSMAKAINMSESGFYAALKNDSFKIDSLKKIADVLNINVNILLGKKLSTDQNEDLESQPRNDLKRTMPDIYPTNYLVEFMLNKSNATLLLHEIAFFLNTTRVIEEFLEYHYLDTYNKLTEETIERFEDNKQRDEIIKSMLPKFEKWHENSKINIESFKDINGHLGKIFSGLVENLMKDRDKTKPDSISKIKVQ